MNITITPAAEAFMRRMIRFNGGTSVAGFRLVVTPGGCSSFNASFTVEAAPQPNDAVLDSNGLKVFLPAETRILLDGVTIDFTDNAMSTGLSFTNPNAQSCACSSSGGTTGSGTGVATVSVASIQRRH